MQELEVVVIAGVSISQDSNGRYCLNDLHRAAGGEERHKPANWLRSQQAVETIEFLNSEEIVAHIRATEQNQALITRQGGTLQGTFAVKELVYAYAMWISPKFHIHVIRTYDALVVKKQQQLESEERVYLYNYAPIWVRNGYINCSALLIRNKMLSIKMRHLLDAPDSETPPYFYDYGFWVRKDLFPVVAGWVSDECEAWAEALAYPTTKLLGVQQ